MSLSSLLPYELTKFLDVCNWASYDVACSIVGNELTVELEDSTPLISVSILIMLIDV